MLRKKIWYQFIFLVMLNSFLGVNIIGTVQAQVHTKQASSGFVTRTGTTLQLDGRTFRFAGANMHWLPLENSPFYTSQFQINDGLDAAKEMGVTVVRSLDMGVSVGCSLCIEPARGVFNQAALQQDDYVIKAAHDRGIRLIIPLTDNYRSPTGGKHTFTDWRDISDENQFFSNQQVIQDFEQYISVLLNHVNIYTGLAYKNDPTIMAWETGNEIYPTTTWTQTISTFLKKNDPHHLVIDGSGDIDTHGNSLKNVDIISTHYAHKSSTDLINDATQAKKAGKAFIVGAFDWTSTNGGDSLATFLSSIETNTLVSGDAFMELWPHDDIYGYTFDSSPYMLHYPGDSAYMRTSSQQLRIHAFRMRGMAVPADSVPGTPAISAVVQIHQKEMLTWRGTAIAASYTIERSSQSANGPWTVVCKQCATDNTNPWSDTTAPVGMLWYRVTANNVAGVAGSPSQVYQAELVPKPTNSLIDYLDDWSETFAHSSNLTFDRTNTEAMHDDESRVCRTTATNEWIVWKQDHMVSFQAVGYFWPSEVVSHFSFYVSANGSNWTPVTPNIGMLHGGWPQYTYTLNDLSGVSYVKVVWNNTNGHTWNPNLGQVTIGYNG